MPLAFGMPFVGRFAGGNIPPGEIPPSSGTWVVPSADSPDQSAGIVTKRPGDDVWFVMDFGNLQPIIDGGVIDGATESISPSGLTVNDAVRDDYRVALRVSGGTNDTDYSVTITVTIDDGVDGITVAPAGTLQVRT